MSEMHLSLAAALSCAAVGLSLLAAMRWNWHRGFLPMLGYATWFFLAAVPPLLFFSLFPDVSAEGEWLTFKVGGAFAAYGVTFGAVMLLMKSPLKRAAAEREQRIVAEIADLRKRVADCEKKSDSDVPLVTGDSIDYSIKGAPDKTFSLFAGHLDQANGFDVWVNSENTNMQMATYFDPSVSGWIRYNGSRVENGRRLDTIAQELRDEMGDRDSIFPAGVLVTSSGALTGKGVRWIIHVATVTGQPGEGYSTVKNLGVCVRNVLDKTEELNKGTCDTVEAGSILIPLLATGSAGAPLEETARTLLDAAIVWLRAHPDATLARVSFIVATKRQRDVCCRILAGESFAGCVESRIVS